MIKKIKNKKAISPMIGYILLISIVVVLSLIVYTWLKTYVPQDSLECPDSTSMFIRSYEYAPNNQLNITIKNNGNFNIGGYFIRAATQSPDQGLAATDLSAGLIDSFGGTNLRGGLVIFELQEGGNTNSFSPNQEVTHVFDISGIDAIFFIELTPIRYQEHESIKRTVTCGSAKIKEEIN